MWIEGGDSMQQASVPKSPSSYAMYLCLLGLLKPDLLYVPFPFLNIVQLYRPTLGFVDQITVYDGQSMSCDYLFSLYQN